MRKLSIPYTCAVNGQEAVDAYIASPATYGIILMDISMPVMDGFTAVALIRKHESRRKLDLVHITALTGVTSQEMKNRAFECGVNDFYSKPVQMKELRRLLTRLRMQSESD